MRGKVRRTQDAVKRWWIVLQKVNPARIGNNGREKLAGEMRREASALEITAAQLCSLIGVRERI